MGAKSLSFGNPGMRKAVIRSARYVAYFAGAVVALLLAAALILPEFLDMPAVESELQAKLSQAAHGTITWEKLSIRLLPSPRGALRKVLAEIPGVANVRAEQVDVHLRLLPLFRGRAEIASVAVSKPEIRLDIAPGKAKPQEQTRRDPVEAYRTSVDAIRSFAPEAVLDIEDAELDVRIAGMPPIRVRDLAAHARTGSKGMEVEVTAASDSWSRLKLFATVGYADLSGAASLEVTDLKAQAWLDLFLASSPVSVALPAASLRAKARTDGKTRLEGDLDLRAETVELVRASERVRVPDVAVTGKVAASREGISVRLSSAQLGASKLSEGSLRYSPEQNTIATLADFDLDLAQVMDGTRLLVPKEAGKSLARFQPVTGRAQGRAVFDMQQSGWSTAVDIRQSDSSIGIEGLPGPVRLAGGSVTITGDTVKIDRADVAMLDSRATASATIGYGEQLRIEGSVSGGSVGESVLAWVWKTASLPPRAILKTPIRVEVQKAAWSPKQPLDLAATAAFDAGPSVAVDLGWTPESLDIRRAAIKDARSDVAIALRTDGRVVEGRISGSLTGASIMAMLKDGQVRTGSGSGNLRFTIDLDHPRRTSADGKLKAEGVDLTALVDRPVKIERIDLAADKSGLRIRDATVNWAEQKVRLRGEVKHGAAGPVIDAQLESAGVVVDALLKKIGEEKPAAAEAKKPEQEDEALWEPWPLPVTGRIAVRSDFIQYGKRKAAPVVARLTLEPQKATLELQKVRLCGISLPLTVAATPDSFAIAGRITAQKQQLEQTARCLTEEGVLISGDFDLSADLRTRGRLRELLPNLEGTVNAELRDGNVMKFALLGNILSMKGVSDLLKEGAPKADSAGFAYRKLSTVGRFSGGRFIIDESAFDSSALGLAATGWISLVDYDSKLSVLVAPFARIDRLARKVPIIGYITGGALTSIPVGVSGDIRDPLVVPLGPSAITSELVGIFERTLKLPGKLVPGKPPAAP